MVWRSVCLSCLLCCFWHAGIVHAQVFNPLPRNQQFGTSAALPRSFSSAAVVGAFEDADVQKLAVPKVLPMPLQPNTPSPGQWTNPAVFRHAYFLQSAPRSQEMGVEQERYEDATKLLQKAYRLTPQQVNSGLPAVDLPETLQDNSVRNCTKFFNIANCSSSDRYRSFDGTCNNLQYAYWGMASCCFERLMPPVYADGVSEMRSSIAGRDLPIPRMISLEIHGHIDNPTEYVNHMFMQWGQFLDHDFALSPLVSQVDNEPLTCCPATEPAPSQCAPILLAPDDPFYSEFNIDCLENARTTICSTCHLGPRQQINQLTAFIDGSMIYGTSTDQSNGLRDRNGTGTLRSTRRGNLELLPLSSIPNNDGCSFQSQTENCFEGGDIRLNQHMALTSLHTIFHRQHNRIAKRLKEINPHWDEERLFQEARRIIGAQLQVITYEEFLPLVLGEDRMQWFDLFVQNGAVYTEYDPAVKPTLTNEFATAAFRFGHSMVNSFFQQMSSGPQSSNRLRDLFLWPFNLYREGHLESVVKGLCRFPGQKFDRYMVRDLTNHLYQMRGNETGLDLASLNIIRGRDHGIPPYVKVVEFCGGPKITNFRQLDELFQYGNRERFERIYESVEDIDLFSGGMAEGATKGAVVGPTFACVIGIQFYHLKYGDRFYFEHGEQAGSFTRNQLQQLKRTTLAKVICENSGINQIQGLVMEYPSRGNPVQSCRKFPDVDLQLWRENRMCNYRMCDV